ncbi:M20 family metallo-hydrolase [Anaerovorax odorimutans]|uniref:M20 family metallo-hydrolase n=1 Tax=Anaerovorax odorimutans TaxID=109327 RepID=A0ABT1RK51_9FIRM|nr:M20 family metallo-hydrolase [Anaerovorax odorimutans]MCQ4635564.1 M20 family metallo-hydrolase [Anaerovorax odorimutans]
MKVNGDQLLEDLLTLKEFTDTPGNGVTRFSYGENDRKAREYIFRQARLLGCDIKTDALKNVRISMPQNRQGRKRVVIGSHVDTVRNGGWLDGIYGVTGGLAVLRALKDCELGMNLELAVFAEEEGSNFGSTMTGSKFIAGDYGEADLDKLKNDEGVSLRRILEEPSLSEIEDVVWDFSEVAAMLELHIEQGPVLERKGLPLGIVDAIFGMQVIEVELTGVGNHAGATPMIDRKDALCAASQCILAAEEIVRPDGRSVVTVGRIHAEPDCSNVIPEKAWFTLEVRDSDNEKILKYMERIIARIKEISTERGVACRINKTSSSKPLRLDPELIERMKSLAEAKGIPHQVMDSGAVHDACMIARHAKTGMIFVPSLGGRSHVPQENTSEKDLVLGAQFLLEITANLINAK